MMQNKISFSRNNKTFADTDLYNNYQPAKFNFNFTCHRVISFALRYNKKGFSPVFIEMLAVKGFYSTIDGGLRCPFCKVYVTHEDFSRYLDQGDDFALRMIFGLPEKAYCTIWDVGSKNLPMGNELNHRFEAHRLYSLLKKNDWQYVGPFSLAKNGFYYTGDGDNVRCVFCHLEVRGWEEGDTAEGEHRLWNPNCPFLCNEQSVGNIKIGSEQTDLKHDSLVAIIPKGAQSYPVAQPAPVMDNQGAQLPAAVPQDEIGAPQGEIGAPQGEAVQQQDP